MTILDNSFLKLRYNLAVDVMYYQIATSHYKLALEAKNQADEADRYLSNIKWYEDYVADDYGDEIDFSVIEYEYDITAMDILHVQENEFNFETSYGLFFQSLAATHIFCAASLEAHINLRAQYFVDTGRIGREDFNKFDWLSLTDKWVELPNLLDVPGFDKSRQPYQKFVELVKKRNALVHYKESSNDAWYEIDSLVRNKSVGLSLKDGETSLSTVKLMVNGLDNILGNLIRGNYNEFLNAGKFFSLKFTSSE